MMVNSNPADPSELWNREANKATCHVVGQVGVYGDTSVYLHVTVTCG